MADLLGLCIFSYSCSSLNSPPTTSIVQFARHDQIVVTHLHLGTCLLTYLHWYTRSLFSECPFCCVPWSIEHLLIVCPTFELVCASLRGHCLTSHHPFGANVLSKPLILFLCDTAFFSSIYSPPASTLSALIDYWSQLKILAASRMILIVLGSI